MRQEKRTVYITDGGNEYFSREAAQQAEIKEKIEKFVSVTRMGRGGEWDPSMIADTLYEHRQDLAVIFASSYAAMPGDN